MRNSNAIQRHPSYYRPDFKSKGLAPGSDLASATLPGGDAGYREVYELPFYSDPTPEQLRQVHADAAALLRLEKGWDGHGGKRISHESLKFLLHILEHIFAGKPDLAAPSIVPLSYGGLQAEWHSWRADFEIEVERPQRFRWYLFDRRTETEAEGEGTTDFAELLEQGTKI